MFTTSCAVLKRGLKECQPGSCALNSKLAKQVIRDQAGPNNLHVGYVTSGSANGILAKRGLNWFSGCSSCGDDFRTSTSRLARVSCCRGTFAHLGAFRVTVNGMLSAF
eukprot:6178566-Pleurochrysis_carterae.AAC.8